MDRSRMALEAEQPPTASLTSNPSSNTKPELEAEDRAGAETDGDHAGRKDGSGRPKSLFRTLIG